MTDTGRAETLIAEMQKGFAEMHNSRKGVLDSDEIMNWITDVAQNFGGQSGVFVRFLRQATCFSLTMALRIYSLRASSQAPAPKPRTTPANRFA